MPIRHVSANIVHPLTGSIFPGTIQWEEGYIVSIVSAAGPFKTYIMPGFVDAHVHIESSMLVPSEFARLAVPHGTVATVSDPHEIANVLGVAGIRFMAANARQVRFKFWWGAPPCVPATNFETAGARVTAAEVAELLDEGTCHYLSEVMNFPGVLYGDADMLAKLAIARERGRPMDGHAPGMRGETCGSYFCEATGISTDHECTVLEEAIEKIACGAKILIREGSAAKNFPALWPLLLTHPGHLMLCSDDKHPDDLLVGHINQLVTRALRHGVGLMDVLRAACVNPVLHYGLPVGLLRVGDPADFIEVDSLEDFDGAHILRTWIDGELVAEGGKSHIARIEAASPNAFEADEVGPADLRVPAKGERIRVIVVEDGQLITRAAIEPARIEGGMAVADVGRDILKIAVVNRYGGAARMPAVGFIQGFGMKAGAIASSVAHDSHNIVAVGTSDELLARAINAVIRNSGGLAAVSAVREECQPLPVAGLMSTDPGEMVAAKYEVLQQMAKGELGSPLRSPFMTLSFMALLVIPELKLSDMGLFDGKGFEFTPVWVE